MDKPKVYFTKNITAESVVEIFKKLNVELKGKVAVKLHSGEKGNQNYIKPEFVKPIIDLVGNSVSPSAVISIPSRYKVMKKLLTSQVFALFFVVDVFRLRLFFSKHYDLEYIFSHPTLTV